ncbi:MAG: HAD-IC family P-type ATPase [Gammaproteobacteria bacterium]|nr:HAD-IC family P-type ATPase [Gammaproteobacteria bacterium]
MKNSSSSTDELTAVHPWSVSSAAVVQQLAVDPSRGLSDSEALRRLQDFGYNELKISQPKSLLAILLDQVKSVIVLLLFAGATLAMLFSDYLEGIAIFAVIIINTMIGFISEWRALRSMESLRRLGRTQTRVLRDGVTNMVAAETLVPGDVVCLEGGDIVTADMRLIEAARLQADESTLTGESIPVRKHTDTLPADAQMADRENMAYKGTAITRGTARGVVTATGHASELGKISKLISSADTHRTPLEKRLGTLGNRLAWVVILLAILVAGGSVLVGRDVLLSIEVAIALAVAAIPEGLPIVATIALARGMWRMSRRNALVARLSAVETLGSTGLILTDKTGTLTENHMFVTSVLLANVELTVKGVDRSSPGQYFAGEHSPETNQLQLLDEFLTISSLCSNASLRMSDDGTRHTTGDPTEVALLVAAAARNLWREDLITAHPEISEVPFDPDTKLMATRHQKDADILIAVKGAPESVIPLCTTVRVGAQEDPLSQEERDHWLTAAEQLGQRGLRTLAVAAKRTNDAAGNCFEGLTLHGVAGMEDPARQGVKEAIEVCHSAGINVIMATGDHAATARNIASTVAITDAETKSDAFVGGTELDAKLAANSVESLLNARVFSRVTPAQKLHLIDFYQQQGQTVAMTGDGVNDAPALDKADIGIAMGMRGTAVAKEAAAMVLQDDEFATIVDAISEGRAIFQNIRKFVVYLFSCNISEVLIISIATMAGAPLPLLPLQILFLNLVTDVFPALALGVGEGADSLMQQKPRPTDEPILTRYHWLRIALHAGIMSATVLLAMWFAVHRLNFSTDAAITISFCTLALAQMWHVFNMRDEVAHPIRNEITRNPWIWLALIICGLLTLAAVYLPPLNQIMKLSAPGTEGWLLILCASVVPLLSAPLVRLIARRCSPKMQST